MSGSARNRTTVALMRCQFYANVFAFHFPYFMCTVCTIHLYPSHRFYSLTRWCSGSKSPSIVIPPVTIFGRDKALALKVVIKTTTLNPMAWRTWNDKHRKYIGQQRWKWPQPAMEWFRIWYITTIERIATDCDDDRDDANTGDDGGTSNNKNINMPISRALDDLFTQIRDAPSSPCHITWIYLCIHYTIYNSHVNWTMMIRMNDFQFQNQNIGKRANVFFFILLFSSFS